MEKINHFSFWRKIRFTRKTAIITAVIVLVIVAAGAYFASPSTDAASAQPVLQTAKARTGDLLVTASGAGTVVPAAQVDLGFRSSGVVTVRVLKGNKLVHPYIGQNLALATTSSTRYLYKSSATAIPTAIALADLKVGSSVSVNGVTANGVWTASRITVGASLSCFP